jgi:hypothetical protein
LNCFNVVNKTSGNTAGLAENETHDALKKVGAIIERLISILYDSTRKPEASL